MLKVFILLELNKPLLSQYEPSSFSIQAMFHFGEMSDGGYSYEPTFAEFE